VDRPRDQRSRVARQVGVLVLALLQVAAAGLAPVADASARAGSMANTLRVEAAGTEDCGSHHDHVTCQFCRVMSLAGETASAAPLSQLAAVPDVVVRLASGDVALASARTSGGVGSRAPPLA